MEAGLSHDPASAQATPSGGQTATPPPAPWRDQALMRRSRRNDRLFDSWSVIHLVTGILAAWVMDPFVVLAVMVLWEPLEVLVLSPLFDAWFGIEFGNESMRNVLSDILFNVFGVAFGYLVLRWLVEPPFILF